MKFQNDHKQFRKIFGTYEEKSPTDKEYWGSLYGDLTPLPATSGEMKLQARRGNEKRTPSQAPKTGQSVAEGFSNELPTCAVPQPLQSAESLIRDEENRT